MNYIEKTINRINCILIDKGCSLCQDDLTDIGHIISNAIMSGIIDTSVVSDVESWINNQQKDHNEPTD